MPCKLCRLGLSRHVSAISSAKLRLTGPGVLVQVNEEVIKADVTARFLYTGGADSSVGDQMAARMMPQPSVASVASSPLASAELAVRCHFLSLIHI